VPIWIQMRSMLYILAAYRMNWFHEHFNYGIFEKPHRFKVDQIRFVWTRIYLFINRTAKVAFMAYMLMMIRSISSMLIIVIRFCLVVSIKNIIKRHVRWKRVNMVNVNSMVSITIVCVMTVSLDWHVTNVRIALSRSVVLEHPFEHEYSLIVFLQLWQSPLLYHWCIIHVDCLLKQDSTSIRWPNVQVIDVYVWRNVRACVQQCHRRMVRMHRAVHQSSLNVDSFVWHAPAVLHIDNRWTSSNNVHVRVRSASSLCLRHSSGLLYI
jgi:hypothetical protein